MSKSTTNQTTPKNNQQGTTTMSNTNETVTTYDANTNQTLLAVTALAGIIGKQLTLPELREEFIQELVDQKVDPTEQYRLINIFDTQAAICRGEDDDTAITATDVTTIVDDIVDDLRTTQIDRAVEELSHVYSGMCPSPVQETDEDGDDIYITNEKYDVSGKMFIPDTGIVLNREEANDVLQRARNLAREKCTDPGLPAVTAGIRTFRTLASYS